MGFIASVVQGVVTKATKKMTTFKPKTSAHKEGKKKEPKKDSNADTSATTSTVVVPDASTLVHKKQVGFHTVEYVYMQEVSDYSIRNKQIQAEKALVYATTEKTVYPSDLVVVLDLDHCLVYFQRNNVPEYSDYCYDKAKATWTFRPGLIPFLKTCMARYETHIFTAAGQRYADPLLDLLEGVVGLKFGGRWYRQHCTEVSDTLIVKELIKIQPFTQQNVKNNNLARIVHVDDSSDNFAANPSNGIPIGEFRGDSYDNCLAYLTRFLAGLERLPDVRPVLKKRFQLQTMFDNGANGFQITGVVDVCTLYVIMNKYGLVY